jgi:hypothetical protein
LYHDVAYTSTVAIRRVRDATPGAKLSGKKAVPCDDTHGDKSRPSFLGAWNTEVETDIGQSRNINRENKRNGGRTAHQHPQASSLPSFLRSCIFS